MSSKFFGNKHEKPLANKKGKSKANSSRTNSKRINSGMKKSGRGR
jgi:hypothetical protein